jgi:hypothetical protein
VQIRKTFDAALPHDLFHVEHALQLQSLPESTATRSIGC